MTDLHTLETTGGCGCQAREEEQPPTLDARAIPPAIRRGAVFGALSSVPPGAEMILVAPHDPVPLLEHLERGEPGEFEVTYLERGPEAWRLLLTRVA